MKRVDILIDYVQLTRHAKPYEAIRYAEEALEIPKKQNTHSAFFA